EGVALGEQFGAGRQVKTFAVPLIDAFRPDADGSEAGVGRPDRVIADFGVALGMAEHAAAEMPGAHLRAEADAEKRLLLPKRHADPADLAADELVLVVGAHGAAEDDGGGVVRHGVRQRLAEARPAHVERIAELPQRIADTARRRVL